MSRKRILGKIELQFIKKNDDEKFTIEIGGQCKDFNYFGCIEYVKEYIEKQLDELPQRCKGGKNE